MLKPILRALFALFDAVKNLEARLRYVEEQVNRTGTGSPDAGAPCRHDAVWEDIEITGKQLRELKPRENPNPNCPECVEISHRQDYEGTVQCICGQRHIFPHRTHGPACNCEKCRTSRGGERI
jgi:hypothetical protein